MSQRIEELLAKCSPSVEAKFKEFLYTFIKKYRDNPTRAKATHLIMNLPVGFFIDASDVKQIFVNNRAPQYNALMELLTDQQKLKKIIGGEDAV